MILTIAAVLAAVIGHPFPYTCAVPPNGWAGMTTWEHGVPVSVTLHPEVCRRMRVRLSLDNTGTSFTAWALATVVHEAEHVAYADQDEAVTECRAIRDTAYVVRRVLPQRTGALRRYLANLYADRLSAWVAYDDASDPPDYLGGVC